MREFFLGPCVLESESLAHEVASHVAHLRSTYPQFSFVFKGSFDKANRSSRESFRGPGLEKGLRLLDEIKKEYSLPVVTDYHLPSQADEVASVVDYLQVPAFLCRQTDMLEAGAKACQKYNRVLKVKKGQFLAPTDCRHIVGKVSEWLPLHQVRLTERGVSFGYHRLVVDMASFSEMKKLGVTVIHDATHCVQMPGALEKTTGGNRGAIVPLAQAAIAAGADGLFMEIHPNPEKALSDSSTCLPLDRIDQVMERCSQLISLVDSWTNSIEIN